MSVERMIEEMAKSAKEASRDLRRMDRRPKDAALELMADKLLQKERDIIKENMKDLSYSLL